MNSPCKWLLGRADKGSCGKDSSHQQFFKSLSNDRTEIRALCDSHWDELTEIIIRKGKFL